MLNDDPKRGPSTSQFGFTIEPTENDRELAKRMIHGVKPEDADELCCALKMQASHTRKSPFRAMHIHRLVLRPMIGHDCDPDIEHRLEEIIATIVAASIGHTKISQHGGAYSVFCIFFRTDALERCIISWLAHHASKNHWSLMENGGDSGDTTITTGGDASNPNVTEEAFETIDVKKRDAFGNLTIGEQFIYADTRYRKVDDRRAIRVSNSSGFAENHLLFYPEDEIFPFA
ncbi:hypothetical protein [Novipirellula rosea]|uniref:Uncharacterized protein n=1 Tax=Novipirellula rosea TaxID=1031540 RepID=A0ABP8N000_9BACT